MAVWQTTTVYPVAMQLGSDEVSRATRNSVSRLIYSYIVRRVLCGLTTANLNNVFQGLAAKFHQDGPSVEAFKAFFDGRDGDSVRFPNDRDLYDGIISKDAYDIAPQPRLVDILWELEEASRSTFAEKAERPTGLWVGHVLPRTWTPEWPFADGEYAPPHGGTPQGAARESVIHTLGNLTLVTGRLNSSAGNKSFAEKKQKFAEHTGLFLNKWFATRDQWGEAEIRERGERLATFALTKWPFLDAF
jgi:hypothetical protein